MSAEPAQRLEGLRAPRDSPQQQEMASADDKADVLSRESSGPPPAEDEAAAEAAADAAATPSAASEWPASPIPAPKDAWKSWKAGKKEEGGVDWPSLVRLVSSRLHGTVKVRNAEKAFCFVACERAKAVFHRDVYVSAREFVGGALPAVGERVSFFLQVDKQVRPRGVQAKVEQGRAEAKEKPEAVFLGSIKSFQEDTGFGFIACPELHEVFGRDVFLHHSQLAGFAVGDRVHFLINVDPVKGTPKAKDLTAALPPPPSRPVPVPLDEEEDSDAAWGGSKLPPTEEEEGGSTASPGSGQAAKESRASDSLETSLVEEVEAAEEPKSPAPCKRVSGTPGAGPGPWKRYALEEGVQAYWWWCEQDGDWFVEGSPGPWVKYEDPTTKEIYWWKDERKWFWA